MKFNSKVKTALSVALMGAVPAIGLAQVAQPGDPTGSSLIVQVWDPATNVGLVEYLTNNFSTFVPGGSDGATSNSGAMFSTQLDGTLTAFENLFNASTNSNLGGNTPATLDFNVIAANNPSSGNPAYMTTGTLGTTQALHNSAVDANVSNQATGMLNLYAVCTTNPCIATGGGTDPATAFITGVGANSLTASVGSVANNGSAVSAALGFFEYQDTGAGTTKFSTATQYKNAAGNLGQWTLTGAGDLVYSIAAGGGTVPLPAAAWLFGSGLLGLLGVGRRRFRAPERACSTLLST